VRRNERTAGQDARESKDATMSPSTTPSLPPNRFRGLSFDAKGERRALTAHEEQIVGLICDGLSDGDIVHQLVTPSSETKKAV
jgi:ATP/maltotriose-dependent transcriptional regulator MalT